jgi:hypothetical protein
MYERWVGFDGNQDMNELPQAVRDELKYEKYSGEKSVVDGIYDLPEHLKDPDFYFTNMFKSLKKKKPAKKYKEDDTKEEEKEPLSAKSDRSEKALLVDKDDDVKSVDSFRDDLLRDLTPMKSIPQRVMLMQADKQISDSEKKEKLNLDEGLEEQQKTLGYRIDNL